MQNGNRPFQSERYGHSYMCVIILLIILFQLRALSSEGNLAACLSSDPPTCVYVKMEESGTAIKLF